MVAEEEEAPAEQHDAMSDRLPLVERDRRMREVA
jgi:hypothetical protein